MANFMSSTLLVTVINDNPPFYRQRAKTVTVKYLAPGHPEISGLPELKLLGH